MPPVVGVLEVSSWNEDEEGSVEADAVVKNSRNEMGG